MLGIGAATEVRDGAPSWVVDGCDRIGAYQQCLRCGRVNRLTTNGVATVAGAVLARGRKWSRNHATCVAVVK